MDFGSARQPRTSAAPGQARVPAFLARDGQQNYLTAALMRDDEQRVVITLTSEFRGDTTITRHDRLDDARREIIRWQAKLARSRTSPGSRCASGRPRGRVRAAKDADIAGLARSLAGVRQGEAAISRVDDPPSHRSVSRDCRQRLRHAADQESADRARVGNYRPPQAREIDG